MNYVATFSGAKYHDQTTRIVEDAPKYGADKVLVYDDVWLARCRAGFVQRMSYFWDHPEHRGCGWFTFKPFVILDALRRVAHGDVVLYTDADTYPIASLLPLYQRCRDDGGVMLFSAVGCVNYAWTKRDAFIVMGCDEVDYWYAQHAVARFMLFEKGGKFPAEHFLWDWLAYTTSPLVNTFDASVLGSELPGFVQNRCEQSVLSNLAKRYGVRLYREACQFGNSVEMDKELFPQTFFQHGGHTFEPGGHRDGSFWRNVED